MMPFLIATLVGGALLYALMEGTALRSKKGQRRGKSIGPKLKKAEVRTRWENIMISSQQGAIGLKSSISEADKLLDYVMRTNCYGGETMADRLRSAQAEFRDLDSVWRAHKLRNALAHEMNFDLVPRQAHEALKDFERALHDLGAL